MSLILLKKTLLKLKDFQTVVAEVTVKYFTTWAVIRCFLNEQGTNINDFVNYFPSQASYSWVTEKVAKQKWFPPSLHNSDFIDINNATSF